MKLKSLLKIFSLCSVIFLSSCAKNDTVSNLEKKSDTKDQAVFKSVTEKEYQEATPFTKRLIDKIDASVTALDIIEKSSGVQYEADFIISLDEKKTFKNSLVISPVETIQDNTDQIKKLSVAEPDGKCTICGLRSAYACIKEVEQYMEAHHTDHIDAHVKRVAGGCVEVTYH